MFGGNLEPPKYVKQPKPKKIIYDIQLPSFSPGIYGHMGRRPNTDYHIRLQEYKRKLTDENDRLIAADSKRLLGEKIWMKYDQHFSKQTFKRLIDERFQQKVEQYNQTIEERRKKLRELLCEEEKLYLLETIERAQKGAEEKMEEMKNNAAIFKAQRERDRMEIVNKKRIQQQMNNCVELRPEMIKRNLIDSKNSQLEQMREKENRREAERELEHMWHELMMKERATKMEKETQDLLERNKTQKDLMEIWEKQVRGKELLKEEAEKVAAEDRLEMMRLQEEIRREEIAALDAKRRKRNKTAQELLEQLALREKFMEQKKKEDDALEEAFARLADAEVEKERQKIQDTTTVAKRETAIYRQYLRELDQERKKEEMELNNLLRYHQKMIEEKQAEARCKVLAAKEALKKSVMQGRAEQQEHKRREAENQLKLKEAENELLRMACETNERLQAEHERLEAEAIRLYREDLKTQIEANKERKRLEREQLEKELKEGIAEEERRRKEFQDLLRMRLHDEEYKHPMRALMERGDRRCPPC